MGIGKIRSGLIDLKNSHQLAMYPFSELIATLYNYCCFRGQYLKSEVFTQPY